METKLNINVGGAKGWHRFPPEIKKKWKIMDVAPRSFCVYNANSGKKIPLEDSSVDSYYCSHLLEHVYPHNIIFFLKELRRTLRSKGMIRIVVPNIEVGISYYLKGQFLRTGPHKNLNFPPTPLGFLMSWFYTGDRKKEEIVRHGHKMAFDWSTLAYYVTRAEFRDIKRFEYGKGSKVFAGKDFIRYKSWSLYMEAKK